MGLADKRILVTGGDGFIGSHLIKALLKRGARVIVPFIGSDSNYKVPIEKQKKLKLISQNITNKQGVFRLIDENKIDFIVHLAAQTLVTDAVKNPHDTLRTNIMGTINVLEAARRSKRIKRVIVASSDKAYGRSEKAYRESYSLNGDHPYDVSKSSADLISQAYFKTYKTPVVITRFGNVYGEGDLHFDRLIPGICKSIVEEETFLIRSNGKYVRDYLYVEDVVDGYLLLLNKTDVITGQAFNFSSSDHLSVLEVIGKMENVLKVKIKYRITNSAINEIPYQHLESSKIRKLGWMPKHTFEKKINSVFKWYKSYLK